MKFFLWKICWRSWCRGSDRTGVSRSLVSISREAGAEDDKGDLEGISVTITRSCPASGWGNVLLLKSIKSRSVCRGILLRHCPGTKAAAGSAFTPFHIYVVLMFSEFVKLHFSGVPGFCCLHQDPVWWFCEWSPYVKWNRYRSLLIPMLLLLSSCSYLGRVKCLSVQGILFIYMMAFRHGY